jgi:aldehyde:ferredoxin oxidoreductase
LGETRGRRGKRVEVACIGQAGEQLSLLAAIINDKGGAVSSSGVGAAMCSKHLKAIAVSGHADVPLFDAVQSQALHKHYRQHTSGAYDLFVKYGTIGITPDAIMSGYAPVKNWGGVGPVDFPSARQKFHPDTVIAYQDRKYGCWRLPFCVSRLSLAFHPGFPPRCDRLGY